MRSKISEKNTFPTFDLKAEYKKLNDLFITNSAFMRKSSFYYISCEEALNLTFLNWKLRGSYTSLQEMMNSLEIDENSFHSDPSKDRLLDYVQFMINVINYLMISPREM